MKNKTIDKSWMREREEVKSNTIQNNTIEKGEENIHIKQDDQDLV